MNAAQLAALLTATVALAACGGGQPDLVLDPVTTTAPTTAVETTDATDTIDTIDTIGSTAGSEGSTTTSASDVGVGERWEDATTNLEGVDSYCGNLAHVSARPDRDQVLVGVAGQGLFSASSDSAEWQPFGRGESSAALDHRTGAVVYDPEVPDRFWEAGYFGLGPPPNPQARPVNRTDDGGSQFIALGETAQADHVSIDFTDPQRRTLVVGMHGLPPTVSRSTDGGATWTDISDGLPEGIGDASYPHVIDAQTYLVGTIKEPSSGIFRTTDGGTTWTRVFDRGVAGPPLASQDGNLYWVLEQGGVITSADDGQSWTPLENRAPRGGERSGWIIELDDGTWVSLGATSVIVSPDGGESWRSVGPALPYAPNGFTYSTAVGAVYIWQTFCDFNAGLNPVRPQAIMRLDLDLDR